MKTFNKEKLDKLYHYTGCMWVLTDTSAQHREDGPAYISKSKKHKIYSEWILKNTEYFYLTRS